MTFVAFPWHNHHSLWLQYKTSFSVSFVRSSHIYSCVTQSHVLVDSPFVQFNSSFEHHQTNLGHLMHNESRGAEHLAIYIMSQPPGHLQTTKNLLCNILSSFLMALRVKGFKHHHFGIRRASIDHKRPIKSIKPFPLSLFSRNNSFWYLFYAVLLRWSSCVY